MPGGGTQLGRTRYEAVVVGTGFGGAAAACRLAQAGVEVAVLGRGRRYPPGSFSRHVAGDKGLLWHHGAGLFDIRPPNDMLVRPRSARRWPLAARRPLAGGQ